MKQRLVLSMAMLLMAAAWVWFFGLRQGGALHEAGHNNQQTKEESGAREQGLTPASKSKAGMRDHAHGAQASASTASGVGSAVQAAKAGSGDAPVFRAFEAWRERWAAADAAGRAALEREGVEIARARLKAMATLIQRDPERALALGLSPSERQGLPGSVAALLEERINTRGDLEVYCVLPVDGAHAHGTPMIRAARVGGEAFRVYTYGEGLEFVSRKNVPLNGVAVPVTATEAALEDPIGLQPAKLMALSAKPARVMDASEVKALLAGAGSARLCESTGKPWTVAGSPTAVEWGGETHTFSTLALAVAWADAQLETAALDIPEAPSNLPVAESSYTEGRKRFLLMRVDFPDYATEAMSTNTALTLMRDFAAFMSEISYGNHIVAPVGKGSDVTPTMRMSQSVASYDGAGLSKLYPEARAAARDRFGYNLDQYDFFFVVTGGKPAYTYAGLGYVGGVGFHLANSYFDVRTSAHEFGHNLGLGHANWWDTDDRSTLGAGTSDEYGDPFDTMGGSGGGVRHFSSYSKNKVGWIGSSDCPTVTSNGTYRLFAQDIAAAPIGVRGLRFSRSGDDYWVEFRQLWTDNKALMNGVSVRLVGGSTTLYDMNPGTSAGKNDHALVIGRTFSEPTLGFHITPIGKGRTYPESLDVVINFGNAATNKPPTAVVLLQSVNGQTATLKAEATDPNGDSLAYAWDFGDGDYSVDNMPTATHSFPSDGIYSVACTVSDMKGGTARHAVQVKIGNPANYTISGRVAFMDGRPMPGIRVSVDSSHYTLTAVDGSYMLGPLNAGTYTVKAVEPILDRFSFVTPFFTNPVVVGPSFSGADFLGSTNSMNVYTPIVAKLSDWRYLDNGSDQGTNWITPEINDNSWSNGPAIFGYGQGNETTRLGYGGDPNNKYITYYFRKRFNVSDPAAYTNLLLEVLRDDGVVVYLNGAEIYRNNMPSGAVNFRTMASDALEPEAYLPQTIPIANLRPGTNVIAAEVHQSDLTSSDVNFDLALSGLSVSNITSATLLYVSSPAHLERIVGPTNLTLSAFGRSTIGNVRQVEFYVDGQRLGGDVLPPYTCTWTNAPVGTHTVHVVGLVGTSMLVTSAPITMSIIAPSSAPPPLSIPAGAEWKYYAAATGPAANWHSLSFDDRAWVSGRAILGYGEGNESTVVPFGPDSSRKWTTTYFRKAFIAPDPGAVENLTILLKRDDGAVVYLNGIEMFRDNMPQGTITYATMATESASDDGDVFLSFAVNPAALRVGTNVLAVEVHQSSANSSDLVFDAALSGEIQGIRDRGVWLTAPTRTQRLVAPVDVTLAAEAVAGGSLGIERIQFFADGRLMGDDTTFPYTWTWRSPAGGRTYVLQAVAVDSQGGTIESASVTVTVQPPVETATMVSFGDVWRYKDDGQEPAANWTARTLDDRTWKMGAAPLGYGGGQTTAISFGLDPARRHITAYFRKSFYLPARSIFSNGSLKLFSDAGGVVYLNGVEVYRRNLLPGLVSPTSLALASVIPAAEAAQEAIPVSILNFRAGTNQVAVELHQDALLSTTALFDLELSGNLLPTEGPGVYLASPGDGAQYNAPARIALSAFVNDTNYDGNVAFYADEMFLGEAAGPAYSMTWTNPPVGTYTLTARLVAGAAPPVISKGVLVKVVPTPQPIAQVIQPLLNTGLLWKYWQTGEAPEGWNHTGFDDRTWPIGYARFGRGLDGEATTLASNRTWYFRRWIQIPNPAVITDLAFSLVRDGGAVVYLNGHEMFRSNLPEGPMAHTTPALAEVITPEETTFFKTWVGAAGSGLLTGSNLLAVELHAAATGSEDAGFDLDIDGLGTTEARAWLISPAAGSTQEIGKPVLIETAVNLAPGERVESVQFYAGTNWIGEALLAPYQFRWNVGTTGSYTLKSITRYLSGATRESNPLDIEVSYPAVSVSLIEAGSVWRYLDNGSNQGTNWTLLEFVDSTWQSGPARLGYGSDGEETTVGYGPSDTTKYITTYFRRTFVVPSGVVLTTLNYRLCRDDGAVVWLNGEQQFRSNMPGTTLSYTNLASAAVAGADEQTYFLTTLPAVGLRAGTNVLAVEIHQSAANSSDMGFDLELSAAGYRLPAVAPKVETQLVDGWLELRWPETGAGFEVLRTSTLLTNDWTAAGVTAVLTNNAYRVRIPADQAAGFFRLRRQQ